MKTTLDQEIERTLKRALLSVTPEEMYRLRIKQLVASLEGTNRRKALFPKARRAGRQPITL